MRPTMLRLTGIGFLVLIVFLFGNRLAAQATTLTYDFSVTVFSGDLAGVSSTGSFSFDSSIIPDPIPFGGALVTGPGLLTDLQFAWNGINYDATSANAGFLIFYGPNMFTGCIGNHVSSVVCQVSGFSDSWAVTLNLDGSILPFLYATPGIGDGAGSYALVPEPSSLGLLGFGFSTVLFATRLRQKYTCL